MSRGPALHLKSAIVARVDSDPGNVWTACDFLDLGPRSAVDTALRRLVASGSLRRIGRGLYDQPRMNSLTGRPAVPDHRTVIDAIRRRDQIRILLDPMTAANDLGLTTAVPARIVVQTDARLKPLRFDNLEITFKQTEPSKLYWAGRPAMRFVQALHWVRDLVEANDPRIMDRLSTILDDRDTEYSISRDLATGLHTLPIWMQTVVRRLLPAKDEKGEPRA